MELESLNCNNCGALLEVPVTANYVKCNHCDSQLAVRRDANATFTQTIQRLNDTTADLADEVAHLRRQNEIAELDRSWAMERENLMVSTKYGKTLPDPTKAFVGTAFAVIFGIIWMSVASSVSPPFALFGLIFIGAAIVSAIAKFHRAHRFQAAKERYQQARRELLEE